MYPCSRRAHRSGPPTTARRMFGAARRISRAWHRLAVEECDRAELAGVNALLLSPIFAPRKGRPALGAPALAELAGALERAGASASVYALGGVTAAEVPACNAAGASGVAAIGAAFAADPGELLRALGILRA